MGKEGVDTKFGFCLDCRDDDCEACVVETCHCRKTEQHKSKTKLQEVPEGFTWEEPPPQRGRHPLTPEIQFTLRTRPGKAAHIKHYDGRSSAYQVVKNFHAGKFKDLDMTEWNFRDVKDGVRGPGSDLYVTYIGE